MNRTKTVLRLVLSIVIGGYTSDITADIFVWFYARHHGVERSALSNDYGMALIGMPLQIVTFILSSAIAFCLLRKFFHKD